MRERQWDALDEKDFEAALEESVPQIPPEEVAAEVTPWKKAMRRVLLGLALRTFTLHMYGLDYLLPGAGLLLSLLGFRSLRRENRWFQCCFLLTALQTAYALPELMLKTTVIRSALYEAAVRAAVTETLSLLGLFCLWRGLRAVQQKAGLPPRAGAAAALMAWYAVIGLLALAQYDGALLIAALIAGYLLILRSLFRLTRALDEAGYAIEAAPQRIPDGCIVLGLAAALLLGCACGYLFGGSYPMDWSETETAEQDGTAEIRARLLELGFPAYVLNDLSAEDIAACDGALRVEVRQAREPENMDALCVTAVGVELPGEGRQWLLIHHFRWTSDPGFYGTELLYLQYTQLPQTWSAGGALSGRVLYDDGEKTFAAPYYQVEEEIRTDFFGDGLYTRAYAAFSLPAGGENCRGYVARAVTESVAVEDAVLSCWMAYVHQQSWLQYPVLTGMERRESDSWSDVSAYAIMDPPLLFSVTP